MPNVISPRTYEKLKKVFKDEEALVEFLEDLNKEFERLENISIQQKESIENNLYSRLVQKLPTKEELQSEIKRLEDKIETGIRCLEAGEKSPFMREGMKGY